MKKQRGGEGEAVGVFVLLLILGIVGGLVWYFTRDDFVAVAVANSNSITNSNSN